jgi:large subunit ribosomal protein L2
MAQLVMPSGEMRMVPENCRATIGQVGQRRRAARLARQGGTQPAPRHPSARARLRDEPYSHPLGGGEGRSGAGRPPCSPWGKLAKGGKTRKRKKSSNRLILRRRTKYEAEHTMSRSMKKDPHVDKRSGSASARRSPRTTASR